MSLFELYLYQSSGELWVVLAIVGGLACLVATQNLLCRWSFISASLMVLTRLLRGFLLILWITVLSLVAFNSLTGGLANSVFPAVEQGGPLGSFDRKTACSGSGSAELAKYSEYRPDPPPIGTMLDLVLPEWKRAIECTGDGELYKELYKSQFTKIEERLRSIARNQGTELKSVTVDRTILTAEFAARKGMDAEVLPTPMQLPPEVQDWVARESARIKDLAQARALFSTFLLLSVLGAFGALIFLIRDYITLDGEKKISDYIFRPVLGIFLAVAVFVVDVLAHSIISTASILQIRSEPLYILALGAGLLSETAYDWVRRNVDSTFSRREEQLRSEQESQGAVLTQAAAPSPAE